MTSKNVALNRKDSSNQNITLNKRTISENDSSSDSGLSDSQISTTSDSYNPLFFNTYINEMITVEPYNLSTGIIANIKSYVEKKLYKKCYKKEFGLITKIHSINIVGDGELHHEIPDGSVFFNVQITVQLCNPLMKSKIVALVQTYNKHQIHAVIKELNVNIIIPSQHVNDKIFFVDNNAIASYYYTKDKHGEKKKLIPGNSYVYIIVFQKSIIEKSENILVLAKMQDIATVEEYEKQFENFNETSISVNVDNRHQFDYNIENLIK